jgi:hypothetical protein
MRAPIVAAVIAIVLIVPVRAGAEVLVNSPLSRACFGHSIEVGV